MTWNTRGEGFKDSVRNSDCLGLGVLEAMLSVSIPEVLGPVGLSPPKLRNFLVRAG